MFEFEKYQTEINKICKKYDVLTLTAFGSSLSDNFKVDSDVDFLLELDKAENGLVRYMKIKFELEKLFTRPVDIVMPKAIKNERIKNYIFSRTKKIYEA
ncbi:MAG: hypothetical protein DWQ06_15375 [Calditrichaeota bacterium]|nr:MAG: hypothetical protein DWQ06_15375 [Calditrichota bacterium]